MRELRLKPSWASFFMYDVSLQSKSKAALLLIRTFVRKFVCIVSLLPTVYRRPQFAHHVAEIFYLGFMLTACSAVVSFRRLVQAEMGTTQRCLDDAHVDQHDYNDERKEAD